LEKHAPLMPFSFVSRFRQFVAQSLSVLRHGFDETALLASGALLSKQQWSMPDQSWHDYEFKVFSQFGDDGLIQYLIKHLSIDNQTFIEFGVEDYRESNTRFLLMHNNWSGYVLDGSAKAMARLQSQRWFWKYDLRCKAVFIDKANINALMAETGFQNLGILHIDLDGNDYHILRELDFSLLNPSVVIMEYNAVFGKDRAISVPYDPQFYRTKAHYSNLYFGASLAALDLAATEKGYSLVGCNLAGNNAYFVRNDLLNQRIQKVGVDAAFVDSRFREGRNPDYRLSLLRGAERLEPIKGLPVLNVQTQEIEKL
jgi:hypothetical protein